MYHHEGIRRGLGFVQNLEYHESLRLRPGFSWYLPRQCIIARIIEAMILLCRLCHRFSPFVCSLGLIQTRRSLLRLERYVVYVLVYDHPCTWQVSQLRAFQCVLVLFCDHNTETSPYGIALLLDSVMKSSAAVDHRHRNRYPIMILHNWTHPTLASWSLPSKRQHLTILQRHWDVFC